MNKLKRTTFLLVVSLTALLANGCKNYEYVSKNNANVCDKNGGIYSMPPLRGSSNRLILCKDGSVRWTVKGGH